MGYLGKVMLLLSMMHREPRAAQARTLLRGEMLAWVMEQKHMNHVGFFRGCCCCDVLLLAVCCLESSLASNWCLEHYKFDRFSCLLFEHFFFGGWCLCIIIV